MFVYFIGQSNCSYTASTHRLRFCPVRYAYRDLCA